MITVLTGENRFLVSRQLRRLVSDFVAEHTDMALEQLDGEEAGFDRLREALQSLPFLASRKLVVLRNASMNKDFIAEAEALLTDVPETTDVVIIETKLDKRTAYYKWLKKHTTFQDYAQLDSPGLASWLVDFAAQNGGTLNRQDATYLVERVGQNQQLLSNEVTKLVHYAPHITRSTIDLLTEKTPASTIFELLDAALAGNSKKALELYAEQRAMKVEPQQILALLGWQLHVLAVVKTAGERDAGQIASEARLNPFVVRKSQGIARRMTTAQVKKLVHDTLELDVRLKSESIDADEALQNLIISL